MRTLWRRQRKSEAETAAAVYFSKKTVPAAMYCAGLFLYVRTGGEKK